MKSKYILLVVLAIVVIGAALLLSSDQSFISPESPEGGITPETPKTREVKLYYFNQEKADQVGDPCSPEAVIPVEREISVTQTPIQDTIRLLIKGELTSEEEQEGFSTEFPHPLFELKGANLEGQTLTLEFTEVSGFTTGGSCRVGLLATQIQKTAKQFSQVEEVVFQPETLFQP